MHLLPLALALGGENVVERVMDVERTAKRRGRQLLVKVRWAGDEYPDWWVPIARLTADLRPVARRLERLKYAEADAAPDPAPSRRAEGRLAALKVNSENAGNSRSVRARATECGEPPSRETRSLAWMWAELL